jgi:hypothetical protein
MSTEQGSTARGGGQAQAADEAGSRQRGREAERQRGREARHAHDAGNPNNPNNPNKGRTRKASGRCVSEGLGVG